MYEQWIFQDLNVQNVSCSEKTYSLICFGNGGHQAKIFHIGYAKFEGCWNFLLCNVPQVKLRNGQCLAGCDMHADSWERETVA